jgi:hypothetical protein
VAFEGYNPKSFKMEVVRLSAKRKQIQWHDFMHWESFFIIRLPLPLRMKLFAVKCKATQLNG